VNRSVSSYAVKHFITLLHSLIQHALSLADYVLDAAKRIYLRPKKEKQPITPDHISRIHELINEEEASLLHQRNFTMMLLCYSGFLRYEEVANLTFGVL